MQTQNFLLSALLSSTFLVSSTGFALAAETIVTKTVTTSAEAISKDALTDPRVAAQNFVAHVNYARVALAMKNGDLATMHIIQARNMIAIIMSVTTEQRMVARVVAGRVIYEYNTIHKYNYFPIETGLAEVKQVSDGPIWAKNSLAVSDAEIVYLTLDLTNDRAEGYLKQAEDDIKVGKLSDAQDKLGELTDAVVTVDEKVAVPVDKAHDNIGIAQNFIKGKNYEGARFALGHADEALDAMQKDDVFAAHRPAIQAMRKEVSDMRVVIAKKDPTLMQKAGTQLDKWMTEVRTWSTK